MGLRQEGGARRRKVENILIGTKEKDNQDKLRHNCPPCLGCEFLLPWSWPWVQTSTSNHFEFGAHAWSLPPALFRPLLSFPSSTLDHPLALGTFCCFLRKSPVSLFLGIPGNPMPSRGVGGAQTVILAALWQLWHLWQLLSIAGFLLF